MPPTDRRDRTAGKLAEPHTRINTCTIFSPENTTIRPPVASLAWSNQSPPGSHSLMATLTSCLNDRDPPHAYPLLLGHPQIWEHPVSLFDEGMANGIFSMQDHGLEIDLPQSQLTHSLLHFQQIDSYQALPLPYNNQAPMPVSIIAPCIPDLLRGTIKHSN